MTEKRKVWEDMLQVLERLGKPISEKQQKVFHEDRVMKRSRIVVRIADQGDPERSWNARRLNRSGRFACILPNASGANLCGNSALRATLLAMKRGFAWSTIMRSRCGVDLFSPPITLVTSIRRSSPRFSRAESIGSACPISSVNEFFEDFYGLECHPHCAQ